ncbi:MAG: thioesterase family protein [Rikenellaceae bacterium]
MRKVETNIQIRFADVDSLQHVNNVNLQHYFDLGKTDYFAKVLDLVEYTAKESFIIASTACQFIGQVRFSDDIYVSTQVEKIGSKSITLFQQIICHNSGEVRAECRAVMVAFNFESQQSFPVYDAWREKMM